MWAAARYDLQLTDAEFYALTPRQYNLLMEAHRRRLAHAEMIQAQTTAAIINYAFSPPEHPVRPSDLCFNYEKPKQTEVEQPRITEGDLVDWQARVANLAAELKRGSGPMLEAIQQESANG